MEESPPRCPFCNKPKKRGSREELVAAMNRAKYTLYAVVGHLSGVSICDKEVIQRRVVETIKDLDDV